MSIMLPKREMWLKPFQMDQSEALLLRMRWGFEDGKPMPISSLPSFQSDPGQNNGRIKKSRISVLMLARKLEDKAKASS